MIVNKIVLLSVVLGAFFLNEVNAAPVAEAAPVPEAVAGYGYHDSGKNHGSYKRDAGGYDYEYDYDYGKDHGSYKRDAGGYGYHDSGKNH
ncbi:6972_t:CDS:2, partial [Funneliformis mosseae]